MSQVRPQFNVDPQPEGDIDAPIEVGLSAFGKSLLIVTFFAALCIAAGGWSVSGAFLEQDRPRVPENPALRSWQGLGDIWRGAHRYPDFSPLSYSMFVVETRLGRAGDVPSAVRYRTVNLGLHIGAVLMLYHLLRRLELPGAFVAAAVFAVHPVNIASAGWISQRPAVLGTLLGLATLVVFLRIIGLNPVPAQKHRFLRLPESRGGLWTLLVILCALTASASPAIAGVIGLIALILIWWERGSIGRADLTRTAPLLAMSGVILAAAIAIAARQGGGDLEIEGVTGWSRVVVFCAQLVAYALLVLAPVRLSFAYEPMLPVGVVGAAAVAVVLAAIAVAWWTRTRYGRGAVAALGLFFVLMLPALIWVRQDQMAGGWVGLHRLYPASAALVVPVVAAIALVLQQHVRLSAGLAGLLIGVTASAGAWRGWLYGSQERLWKDVLASNPSSQIALTSLAAMSMPEKHFTEAQAYLEAAVQARPRESVAAIIQLGTLAEQQGEHEQARNHYLRAVSIEPENFDAIFGLARTLAALHDSAGALRQYDRALKLRPNDAMVHSNIGLAHFERGELDSAEASYRRAIQLDARCVTAKVNLANLLYKNGDVEAAARELESVLEIDQANWQAFMNAGAMLGQMRQFDKAARAFRTVIILNDKMPHAYSNLGMALLGQASSSGASEGDRRGLLSEAVLAFQKAMELDPSDASFRQGLETARRMRDSAGSPQ